MNLTWIDKNKDIGEVKEKSSNIIIFECTEDIPSSVNITSSCGCSVPVKISDKRIRVSFNAGKVPVHLLQQGYYTTTKYIYLTDMLTGEQDKLSFTAKIVL